MAREHHIRRKDEEPEMTAITALARDAAARLDRRMVAVAILFAASATIGAALVFEHAFGYLPCALCLQQRWPYYLGIPLAAGAVFLAPRRIAGRAALAALAALFVASAGLAFYHVGVEAGIFAGPADCGAAAAQPMAGSMDAFLAQLETVRVVSCSEVTWRFLGLSMAGWNGLISLGIAGAAGFAAARLPGRLSASLSRRRAG